MNVRKLAIQMLAVNASFTLTMIRTVAAEESAEVSEASLANLARNAVSAEPDVTDAAIAALRDAGQAGLDALVIQYGDLIQRFDAGGVTPELARDPAWPRFCAALERVGRAKDNYAARLFWYTDFEQAKAAARASGKPILSLRLLGNLDDEFSCANSRFFRSIL